MDFWGQFWSTMWGALAGALVGGGVSAVIAWRTALHTRRLRDEQAQSESLWRQEQGEIERRRRYEDRFVRSLSDLMAAIGQRALDLETWLATPIEVGGHQVLSRRSNQPGGGPDHALQTAADICCSVAEGDDLDVVSNVTGALWHYRRHSVRWQIETLGQTTEKIREWRNGLQDENDLLDWLDARVVEIEEYEAAREAK